MSNHFHELRDAFWKNLDLFEGHMSEMQMATVGVHFLDKSKDAVCFYAGDVSFVNGFSIIDDLVRIPYPVLWIEADKSFEALGNISVGYLLWEADGAINGQVFKRAAGKWCYLFGFIRLGGGAVKVAHFRDGIGTSELRTVIGIAFKFLSALNCTNINRVEHKPPEKLQKARAKRGKKPLFSYWTLEIDLPKSRAAGEDYGGTHASPRLHLRRGHPRQYAPGKYCWVQPCVVGNKAAGMVHKDYAARYL